jgi:hypothetical protein
MATVKMCEDLPQTLMTKEQAIAPQQCTISCFLFHQRIFGQKENDYHSPPTLLFSVSPIGDKTEKPPF